jgi:ring-1,2-phenylacetyl-CoA epoxidase subunit PaaE
MTPTFHRLKVSGKRAETADSASLRFEVPESLRQAYRFRAGQFITLRAVIEGQALRRSYSICIGTDDYERSGELRVGIKRVSGGVFSNWALDHIDEGAWLDVMTPDGRFNVEPDPQRARHHVAFAGGSGITPVLSLIKTTLALEPLSRFTLVYGNRNLASIMFLEELEDLKNRYLNRLRLYHVLAEEAQEIDLFNGLLDRAKADAFLASVVPAAEIDEAFVCGPQPMMDAVEAALIAAGVAAEHIHVERFGVPVPARAPQAIARPDLTASSAMSEVLIISEGKQRQLRIAQDGPAVLDAALSAGMDLPYACKGGVCCTCRARVTEGEVRMQKNYTLEPWEVSRGFVLTCQAHPVSERVVINYDER